MSRPIVEYMFCFVKRKGYEILELANSPHTSELKKHARATIKFYNGKAAGSNSTILIV
jgi:hypothetical protein